MGKGTKLVVHVGKNETAVSPHLTPKSRILGQFISENYVIFSIIVDSWRIQLYCATHELYIVSLLLLLKRKKNQKWWFLRMSTWDMYHIFFSSLMYCLKSKVTGL